MNKTARRIIVRVSPPILTDWVRGLRAGRQVQEWTYLGPTWPVSGQIPGAGWADDSVSQAQLAGWHDYTRSVLAPKPLGASAGDPHVTTEVEYARHNTYVSFGYVAGLAAAGRDEMAMLDWGGGIGQYAVLTRSVLPAVRLDYHCFDLPPMVNAGRTVLPEATFHESEEEALSQSYDLVLASSSLQYVGDWGSQLERLRGATSGYCYVTRLPIALESPSFVIVQRPHVHGYMTEYPGWVINRRELLDRAERAGFRLEREFLTLERPLVPDAPEQPEYRGFLFSVPPPGAA